jgi:hydroxyethylthiazole kinase-like uncharacterized protein yjeF
MQRVLPPSHALPLFGAQATRAIEQEAAAGLPPHTLMRRAGRAVARLALALAPHARTVWVCAGPGNNGGDGFEAAIHLLAAGKDVRVRFIGDPGRLPDDARDALGRAGAAGVRIEDAAPALDANDLAIDALLGIGVRRPPSQTLADTIAALNALSCPVLAVDLPSGLDATTGQPLGTQCVQASHTLALLGLKPGLFTGAGRDQAGSVWFDDLGVAPIAQAPDAWLSGPGSLPASRRLHAQHKGSFGDVAVVGGAPGMSGAALLAARAAHAAGAGRVYLSLLDDAGPAHDPLRPELMCRTAWWKSGDDVLQRSVVVCGCGGGDRVREPLPRLLGAAGRLVLDADALNVVASDPALQALLRSRASRGRGTVLTPHPLEAARLLASDTAQVQSNRLEAAQALADRFACVVLLKGSGSVIAAPGQAPFVNPTGNAALATAGTGDVLAGWLGGSWARHGAAPEQVQRVACAAAFAHGAAADGNDQVVLRATDLIDRMR